MLANWVARGAELLDPLVRTLVQYVLSGAKLHADDTPVPVLCPGRGKTRTARLWAYVRDDRPSGGSDPPAVLYRYSPDRKAQRPEAHLRAFRGVLQADGYSGFAGLYREGCVLEAACWAHYPELSIMPSLIASAASTTADPNMEALDNTRAGIIWKRGRRAGRASEPKGALARMRGPSGSRTSPRHRASFAGSLRRTDWSSRCWRGRDSHG